MNFATDGVVRFDAGQFLAACADCQRDGRENVHEVAIGNKTLAEIGLKLYVYEIRNDRDERRKH